MCYMRPIFPVLMVFSTSNAFTTTHLSPCLYAYMPALRADATPITARVFQWNYCHAHTINVRPRIFNAQDHSVYFPRIKPAASAPRRLRSTIVFVSYVGACLCGRMRYRIYVLSHVDGTKIIVVSVRRICG